MVEYMCEYRRTDKVGINEQCRKKTRLQDFWVRHKPGYTSIEDGLKLAKTKTLISCTVYMQAFVKNRFSNDAAQMITKRYIS